MLPLIPEPASLPSLFGDIDIYLFDQLLKGRIQKEMRVLDAGCGNGRNSFYLIKSGIQVYGADQSVPVIEKLRQAVKTIAPEISDNNFIVSDLSRLSFENNFFDV